MDSYFIQSELPSLCGSGPNLEEILSQDLILTPLLRHSMWQESSSLLFVTE